MTSKLRYSEFANRIDVDAWEEAVGFDSVGEKHDEDLGYCLDPWGLHSHGDTSGKLAVNREKRVFNCWVCGGGSLLSYTMALKDWDEVAATDWLYEFTRPVDESNDAFESEIDRLLYEEVQSKPTMPYFNENVLKLWLDWPEEMYDWLGVRGISEDIAVQYWMGYNPETKRKSAKCDYVGPSIVLPLFWNDRLVGWQNRWLGDFPKWIPKYTNTNDFPRNETLWNFEGVFFTQQPVMVVESVPVALYLLTLGYPVVATFGSNVTPEQMRLMRYFQQGIVLAPDNDSAGRKCAATVRNSVERFIPVFTMQPVGPEGSGCDLGDLVTEDKAPKMIDFLYRDAQLQGYE